ncbi:MAG: YceI family protein [Vicinamibacteria bacterium]|nr:YceI family protein [Vicinamibacteria bacterium]
MRRIGRVAVAVAVAWGWASVAGAQAPAWQVTSGDVKVLVPMKPGGSFETHSTSLTGKVSVGAGAPLPVGGELAVDLATLDTGIALRNQHLRENYLQVARGEGFARAVLSELGLRDATGAGFEGRTGFTATLLLHGVKKPVAGSAALRREGAGVRVEASFPLALSDFGIRPPEYLGVGVGNRLIVSVSFVALPATGGK